MSNTTTQDITEEIIASRSDDDTWEMREVAVSSLWKDALGPGWEDRIDAEYFRYFWGPILKKLGKERVQKVLLDCHYIFGVQTDPEIREYMAKTSSVGTLIEVNPQMLVVSHQSDDNVVFCHLEVREVTTSALSMADI